MYRMHTNRPRCHVVVVLFICVACLEHVSGCIELQRLQQAYWENEMEMNPSVSTLHGMYQYNDLMESYTLDTDTIRTTEFMEDLRNISRDDLDAKEKVNYDVLNYSLQTVLDSSEGESYSLMNPISSMFGIQLYARPSSASSLTRGDFENFIMRLQSVQRQVDEIKELCRTAIELNRTLHNVSMARVPEQIDMLIYDSPEDWLTYENEFFWKLNDSHITNETIREDIRQRGREATLAYYDALRDLKDFIIDEYMPHTRKEYGVYAWDPTNTYYKACLKWHLTVDMSPKEIHTLGLKEVERINMEMKKILKGLNFTGTVRDFFESLSGNETYYAKDMGAIIDGFHDVINVRIKPKLNMMFKDIPDIPLEIIPAYTLSSYQFATDQSPGQFLIDITLPKEVALFEMMALSLHETNPGHHLQQSYALAAGLPEFRRNPSIYYSKIPNTPPTFSAYTEGWGLYAEYLGEEMGLYKDDYEMMGRYSFELLRAARLVLDTGIHYKRWNRTYAIDYLMNNSALSEQGASTEVDRYITLPGQACAYKVGEQWILRLRKEAETELGSYFDIKDFHSVILKTGPVPLPLLERVLRDWILQTKSSIPSTTPDSIDHAAISASSATSLPLRTSLKPMLFATLCYLLWSCFVESPINVLMYNFEKVQGPRYSAYF